MVPCQAANDGNSQLQAYSQLAAACLCKPGRHAPLGTGGGLHAAYVPHLQPPECKTPHAQRLGLTSTCLTHVLLSCSHNSCNAAFRIST